MKAKTKPEPLTKEDIEKTNNIDKAIAEIDIIHNSVRSLYLEQRKVYLDNPFWGFGELVLLLESKIIKMKQSTTTEKRQAELMDIIVYCEMAIALKKYYDRKGVSPIIYDPKI